MRIFKRFVSGVVIAIALLATLGCAGERRNVFPQTQSLATPLPPQLSRPATITAHISNCSEIDPEGGPSITCHLEFVPLGKDGKYDYRPQTWPNVRVSVTSYPDTHGDLTVELSPGSYEVWFWSSHFRWGMGRTAMGIGVSPGASVSINLDASAQQ